MAMKFGGFTPEQMGKIIPEMQGMQAQPMHRLLRGLSLDMRTQSILFEPKRMPICKR